MKILVVDAQGGGIGRQLVASIKASIPAAVITAVGTNSAATSNMLRAGADIAATGENAVIVGARKADIIVGPVGIVIADSLYGEITPKMAAAIGQSDAKRILIPINHCDNIIAGVPDLSVGRLVESAVNQIKNILRAGRGATEIEQQMRDKDNDEKRIREAEDLFLTSNKKF